MKHRISFYVGLLAALLGVAGCGGGGGGDGSGGGNTPTIKAWGTAQLIETNGGNASGPQIAFDGNGNALAVWEQSDGTRDNIWANRFSAASGAWGTAQLIETEDGDASAPRIAFDAKGNALAVWSQSDGTRHNIWANRFSAASGAWGTAQSIEPGNSIGTNAGDAFNSRIAIDAGGNAFAVWERFDGTRDNIWASRFSAASGAWGTAQLLETDNAGDADFPQIAVDANGNALAVWQQFEPVFGGTVVSSIWANRFKAGSGWGTPELVEIEEGMTGQPQVAFDAGGNAMAVWVQIDPQRNILNVRANLLSAGSGAWGTAKVIGADAGDAGAPQIAFDAAGNAIAVWHQSDGTRFNVRANRFSAGSGAWGTAQLIETDNAGNAAIPQIAFDAGGNAIAVWQQFDGARFNIWANRFH